MSMKFEKLTIDQLKVLKSKGFNILTSNNQLTDEQVIWFPETVEDVCDYVFGVAEDEPTLLVIDDAIRNLKNEDLIGEVFI